MAKPKRIFKSEVDLSPILQVELVPPKTTPVKDKELPVKKDPSRRFDPELILGIIERIKKL